MPGPAPTGKPSLAAVAICAPLDGVHRRVVAPCVTIYRSLSENLWTFMPSPSLDSARRDVVVPWISYIDTWILYIDTWISYIDTWILHTDTCRCLWVVVDICTATQHRSQHAVLRCVDMSVDMCVDMCLGMCAGMCTDMCRHVYSHTDRHAYRCVCGQVCNHVQA